LFIKYLEINEIRTFSKVFEHTLHTNIFVFVNITLIIEIKEHDKAIKYAETNKSITDVPVLGSIHTLILSGCTRITDVSPLSMCCIIQLLALWNCTGLTEVSALSICNGLHTLHFYGCD